MITSIGTIFLGIWILTARQLDINIVRVVVQVLAAVLAGTHSLPTNVVGEVLDRFRIVFQSAENRRPYMPNAVRPCATLGELVDVMRDVFYTYQAQRWI